MSVTFLQDEWWNPINTTAYSPPPFEAWRFFMEDMETMHEEQIVIGQKMRADLPIEPGMNGLHFSVRIIDALYHAHGPMATRVLVDGSVVHAKDCGCATERTALWCFDASALLHQFAIDIATDTYRWMERSGIDVPRYAWEPIEAKQKWLDGSIDDAELFLVYRRHIFQDMTPGRSVAHRSPVDAARATVVVVCDRYGHAARYPESDSFRIYSREMTQYHDEHYDANGDDRYQKARTAKLDELNGRLESLVLAEAKSILTPSLAVVQ